MPWERGGKCQSSVKSASRVERQRRAAGNRAIGKKIDNNAEDADDGQIPAEKKRKVTAGD